MKFHIFVLLILPTAFSSDKKFSTDKGEFLEDLAYQANWKCLGCTFMASVLKAAYFASRSQDCLAAIVSKVCTVFRIENSQVCDAISTQYRDEVLYVVGELLLNPHQFCGFILRNCSDAYNPLNNTWLVPLPKERSIDQISKPIQQASGTPTIRVLHLSDIHLDPLYEAGSEADCSYPLCCRKRGERPPTTPAGKWGYHGKCDTPLILLENLFEHLKQNETFDYIIWTGDFPPHDVWNQTRSDQLEAYKFLTDILLRYFPNKLVFAAVGNHESAPADSFPPHFDTLPKKYGIDWLYDALADHWTKWLPKSARSLIRKKASYMVKIFPGLRLIAINTNYCLTTNFWLYLNDTDPDGGLTWLVAQLYDAEKAGDKVHIIAHSPSGDSTCLPQWSYNYYRIITRFRETVVAQFFGHTHTDHFQVFYEDSDFKKRPINIAYVGPSVTPYESYMPSYRIYTIDGNHSQSTWKVLNHETYYANLTEANIRDQVEWKLEYKAKEDYGMSDLSPDSWSKLINQSLINRTLADMIVRHYYRRTDVPCDRNCTLDILCELRSARSGYPSLCSDFPFDVKKIVGNGGSTKINFKEMFAIPFVPKECRPKMKQMPLKGDQRVNAINQNCQIIENECHISQCGQICDGIVAEHIRFGQPSQLDNCRKAVCHVESKCCCVH